MSAVEDRPVEDTAAPTEDGKPFDPIAYHQTRGQARRKSLRGLVELCRSATRLAREASPRLYRLVVGMQLFAVLLLAAQVVLAKVALTRVFALEEGSPIGPVVLPLVGVVLATAVAGAITVLAGQLQRLLGEQVQQLTWSRILDVTVAVPVETFESSDFFDDLQRVRTMALLQPLQMSRSLVQLAAGVLGAIALIIALLFIQPLVLPLVVVGALPMWLLSRRSGRMEFDFVVKTTTLVRRRDYLTHLLTERDQAKEIRAFELSRYLRTRWAALYGAYIGEVRRHVRRRSVLALGNALVGVVVTVAAVVLVLLLVVEGEMPLASAGAALIAVRLLASRAQTIAVGVGGLFESSLFLADFERFLARAPARTGPTPVLEPFDELRLTDGHFRYPGAGRDAVDGVTLSIRAGEVVALVGENGSGKTTLAKVLAGLYAPTGGTLHWDETDVATIDPVARRRHVGVIFQDFVRYQLSARENVGFGRHERLDDLPGIADAARRAGAEGFLDRLPDGLETPLGKEWAGGHDLSGGQWQRVALARAFFRDAHLLILDEPTAALDARGEHEVFERVRALADGRSVVLVSHRFSTVRSADRILVLDAGRVVEQGSHDDLMREDGRYAELYRLQADAYR